MNKNLETKYNIPINVMKNIILKMKNVSTNYYIEIKYYFEFER